MRLAVAPFLRTHRWLTFLLQQAGVFLLSFGFVTGVKLLTGKSIHGGRDAMGPFEYLGMVTLFAGLIAFTIWMFRLVRRPGSTELPIRPSGRGARDLLLGTVVGFLWLGWPKLVALATGALQVKQTIFTQGSAMQVALLLLAGTFTLTSNSVMEEITNRAFPLELWRDRGLAFRLVFPAVMFAVIHLAVEPFELQSFLVHTVAGLALAAVYLLTGNIWLAAGIHTGSNEAVLFTTTRWQMGGLLSVDGPGFGPESLHLALWALMFVGALGALLLRERANGPAIGQPVLSA